MGSDDLFKKKRERDKARKKEFRTPKPNSFLIVSEGEKTEALYFNKLAAYINSKYGDGINVEKPTIVAEGEGRATCALVNEAVKIVSRANIVYSQVWIVFDKDDFTDFDEAIDLAKENGFKAAWSNQSFEYWIYLHFHYSDAALHRDCWEEKVSEIFKTRDIDKRGYRKNDPDVFNKVITYGSLKTAVSGAIRVEKKHGTEKPSKCDPCTKVYKLILELKPWIEELL